MIADVGVAEQIISLERAMCHKSIWPATKGKEEKAGQKSKEKQRWQQSTRSEKKREKKGEREQTQLVTE